MKRLITGLIVGLFIGVAACLLFIDSNGYFVDLEKKCSKPEYIYYLSQILGVIVTFLAVVVALFGNELRSIIFRPKCKISLSKDGFDENLGDTLYSTSPQARYYDCTLNVENSGSKEISNCELIVTEISYMSDRQQKRERKLLVNGHQSLYWFYRDKKKIHLIEGEQREVCLFRIYPSSMMQTPDGGEESPLRLNISGFNLEDKYSQKGIWSVKYKLQDNERILRSFSVTVEWTGKWFDRISEMSKELNTVIREIKK